MPSSTGSWWGFGQTQVASELNIKNTDSAFRTVTCMFDELCNRGSLKHTSSILLDIGKTSVRVYEGAFGKEYIVTLHTNMTGLSSILDTRYFDRDYGFDPRMLIPQEYENGSLMT